MLFDIEINGQDYPAKRGETIKNVLDRAGIRVPTLCYMNGFTPTGGCRMCVVEVEGVPGLVPSCSHPVTEWMKIRTHSPRVLKARKVLLELLLAGHPDDCLYCDRNGNCGLQDLSKEMGIRDRKYHGRLPNIQIDKTCPSIIRDPAKCILCGRCIRVCDEIIGVSAIDVVGRGNESRIGTSYNKGLSMRNCVKCGQCIMVCPTGALTERSNLDSVLEALNNPDLYPVIQLSPTVAASVGEDLNIRASKDIRNLLRAGLKKAGFRQVYDVAMAADVAIMEEAAEYLERTQSHTALPLLTSCCPSWVKYIESSFPALLPHLSRAASPQQIMGRLIKHYIASSASLKPEQVFVVSVMPCTAKKHEAAGDTAREGSLRNVDAVLTNRELVKLVTLLGIDFPALEPEPGDPHFSIRSSAGNLFGVSGGHLEGLLRTIQYMATGQDGPVQKLTELRGLKSRKEARVKIGKTNIHVAAVSGLANVRTMAEEILAGKSSFSIIEVMACPNGCINGGGQKVGCDEKQLKARMKMIYDVDEEEIIRSAHKSPAVIDLYERFLAKPGSDRNKELLHAVRNETTES